jgi:anti-sigma regulatory factor (Ser/Thr protein kinase)
MSGPGMTPDRPEAAAPRLPSCPDRRLQLWPGQRRDRMLPRRDPQNLPLARVLPGTPESAGLARQLARDFLGEAHPDAETVVLIVSELVTNAVIHSRSGLPGGNLTISLCTGEDGVFVQVRDDGGPSGQWETTAPGLAAEHGYGLLLVDALADSWGTACDRHGRVTWCRVRGPSRSPGQRVVP